MKKIFDIYSKLKIYYIFIKDYKPQIFILFIMLFVNMILSSFGITLLLPIINILIEQEPANIRLVKYIYKFFDFINIKPTLFNILFIFMGLVIINNFIKYFEIVLRGKLQRDIVYNAGRKIFENLMNVNYSFYHNVKKGDVYYYINGAACYLMFTLLHLLEIVFNIFMIFGYLFILLSISLKLTINILILGTVSIVIYKRFITITRRLSKKLTELNQKFNSMFVDTIDGIKVVKSYNREEFEKQKFNKNWFDFLDVLYTNTKNSAIIASCSSPVSFLMIILLLLYAHSYLKMPFALLSVYILLIYKLIPIFQMLPTLLNSLVSTLAPVDIALEAISEKNKPYLQNGKNNISGFNTEILLKNMSFKYVNDYVIHNVNLKINKNETTAIIGATGSGKSTLIDLILRLYDPTDGNIIVDGLDLKEIKIEDWRNICAVVQQDVFLFNDSVRNNILYGKLNASEEEIIESAKKSNAYNFIMNLPEKFDTVIGERGVKLSGGQKQMLSLARAIIRNPQIMIMDEATSSLDNESERQVQKAIDFLKGKMTIIVIAHRLSTILNADKIVVLDKGRIVEEGSHSDLIDKNSFYTKYYNLQFSSELKN